jgi:hypothetical protein
MARRQEGGIERRRVVFFGMVPPLSPLVIIDMDQGRANKRLALDDAPILDELLHPGPA